MIRSLSTVLCLTLIVLGPQAAATQSAVLEGHRVHYVDRGQGDPALVFIHGWACDVAFWDGQVGPLSAHTRVLAVDLPGHGRSDAPDIAYTQRHFAEAVGAVLDDAGVGRAVLVGHSMGGSVARWAAVMDPERVVGVVLVDAAIFPLPGDVAARQAWEQQMGAFVAGFEGSDGEALTEAFVRSLHAPATPDAIRETVLERMLATARHVRQSAMAELVTVEAMDLPPVAQPTLAVYAPSDGLPPNYGAALRPLFPDLRYQLWHGLGHFLMMERPEAMNAEILSFLERLR